MNSTASTFTDTINVGRTEHNEAMKILRNAKDIKKYKNKFSDVNAKKRRKKRISYSDDSG